MVVERFSQNVINSGIFRIFIATGFFATLIFFVINADYYTPLEMIAGVMGVTVALKGLCNVMLGVIVASFNLDNKEEEFNFRFNKEKIDVMLSELAVQEAQVKAVESSKQE